MRCAPRLAQEQRGALLALASPETSPSNLTTLLDLCVGNLEPKWPRSVVVVVVVVFETS